MKAAAIRSAGFRIFSLPAGDLLRDAMYRRLWGPILISSFGAQITMLALPLTAMETVPFVLFSLPCGVWLDRVHKLPVYVGGEITLAAAVASVPLASHHGVLSMAWLYVIACVTGTLNATAGSAAQIVLTQVVARERLVDAHAKNALAVSGSEVAGPGVAGALIKLLGAPVALFFDAALLLTSALAFSGGVALLMATFAWRLPRVRSLRRLPEPADADAALGADAAVRSFKA